MYTFLSNWMRDSQEQESKIHAYTAVAAAAAVKWSAGEEIAIQRKTNLCSVPRINSPEMCWNVFVPSLVCELIKNWLFYARQIKRTSERARKSESGSVLLFFFFVWIFVLSSLVAWSVKTPHHRRHGATWQWYLRGPWRDIDTDDSDSTRQSMESIKLSGAFRCFNILSRENMSHITRRHTSAIVNEMKEFPSNHECAIDIRLIFANPKCKISGRRAGRTDEAIHRPEGAVEQ